MKRLFLGILSSLVGVLVFAWVLPGSPGRAHCPMPGHESALQKLSQTLSKALGVSSVVWAQDPCVASCGACSCSCSCGCSCGCGCYGGCYIET